jgi:hypothetical protein
VVVQSVFESIAARAATVVVGNEAELAISFHQGHPDSLIVTVLFVLEHLVADSCEDIAVTHASSS